MSWKWRKKNKMKNRKNRIFFLRAEKVPVPSSFLVIFFELNPMVPGYCPGVLHCIILLYYPVLKVRRCTLCCYRYTRDESCFFRVVEKLTIFWFRVSTENRTNRKQVMSCKLINVHDMQIYHLPAYFVNLPTSSIS